MNFRKNISSNSFIFSLLLIVVIFSLGAMKIYQTGKLKSDGSGSIKITYSAKADELKENQFIIGNFPFSEELAKKQFASPNTTVTNVKLDFDKSQSMYFVTVEVDFKNINKLSETRGFSNVKASYQKKAGGNVFRYVLSPNAELYKNIVNQTYIIDFESKVLSSSGAQKDNTVTWVVKSQGTDFSKEVVMVATTEADKDPSGTKETSVKENAPKEEKSCGLFGLELPMILLGGYIFSNKFKRKK